MYKINIYTEPPDMRKYSIIAHFPSYPTYEMSAPATYNLNEPGPRDPQAFNLALSLDNQQIANRNLEKIISWLPEDAI